MIRRPPRSTQSRSSAASDVYKRQVLDLRNNPGGLLSEAVNVASVFINDGTIVSYQTKGHGRVSETAKGGAETDLPLVVLANGASASSCLLYTPDAADDL